MTDDKISVPGLRRLLENASPAPWLRTEEFTGQNWLVGFGQDYNGITQHITTDGLHASDMNGADAKDDAEMLVALRNAAPALLRLAEADWRMQQFVDTDGDTSKPIAQEIEDDQRAALAAFTFEEIR